MPINRTSSGKHWCAPERENPVPRWVCPECKTVWLHTANPATGGGMWERPEDQQARIQREQTEVPAVEGDK